MFPTIRWLIFTVAAYFFVMYGPASNQQRSTTIFRYLSRSRQIRAIERCCIRAKGIRRRSCERTVAEGARAVSSSSSESVSDVVEVVWQGVDEFRAMCTVGVQVALECNWWSAESTP